MSQSPDAFWSQDYRGLAIVAHAEGDADSGYRAFYKVNRPRDDGSYETVAEVACDGLHRSADAAREAAIDAAQAHVERLLPAD